MGKAAKPNQIKLECTECHTINYFTRKNKKLLKDRLLLKKFCNKCSGHKDHKETK